MTNRFYILFEESILRVSQKGIKAAIKRGEFGWVGEGDCKQAAERNNDWLFKQYQMPKGLVTNGGDVWSEATNVHVFDFCRGYGDAGNAELMATLQAWRKLF
tara:strand:+ start:60 stop:365 length:306 start_codon:yes stop_codon:yes gene_type:complete